MKKIINILYLSSLLLTMVASPLYAQKESGKVFRGNKEYEKQDYTAAEVEYRRGIEANKESLNAGFRRADYFEEGRKRAKRPQWRGTRADSAVFRAACLVDGGVCRTIADTL